MEHLCPKRLQDGAADPLPFLLVYVSGQVMARAPLREWRMGRGLDAGRRRRPAAYRSQARDGRRLLEC